MRGLIALFTQPNITSRVLIEPSWPFAAEAIETWQVNSSTGNTPTAIKIWFPWQLTLSQSPQPDFIIIIIYFSGDFKLKKII